ncbi:MAG: hypothetical protein ABFS56_03400 [Pseudomonadota bacterium]
MNNLQFLSLNRNQLSGSIPAEMGNLSQLGHFRLENNAVDTATNELEPPE